MNFKHTIYYREYRRRKEGKPDYNQEDMVKCLLCGTWFILLGAHVWQTHKMYMLDYKIKFGLDTKRGRTVGQFRKLKQETNRGLENLEAGASYRFNKGDRVGIYKRSEETIERLRQQGLRIGETFGGYNKKEVNKK